MLATMCFTKIAYFSIQHGQWADLLFHWQRMLDHLYESKSKFKNYMFKVLGGCIMCFSHAIAFVSFWLYLFFCLSIPKFWITDIVDYQNDWRGQIVFWGINVIWYVIYMSITVTATALFVSPKEK